MTEPTPIPAASPVLAWRPTTIHHRGEWPEGYWKTAVGRGLRLRCPVCGKGRLFSGIFRVPEKCPACGAPYAREAGFFLGSIYINYGLTALIAAVVYPILMFNEVVPISYLNFCSFAFVVIFPLLFFRHARSLCFFFE